MVKIISLKLESNQKKKENKKECKWRVEKAEKFVDGNKIPLTQRRIFSAH